MITIMPSVDHVVNYDHIMQLFLPFCLSTILLQSLKLDERTNDGQADERSSIR